MFADRIVLRTSAIKVKDSEKTDAEKSPRIFLESSTPTKITPSFVLANAAMGFNSSSPVLPVPGSHQANVQALKKHA